MLKVFGMSSNNEIKVNADLFRNLVKIGSEIAILRFLNIPIISSTLLEITKKSIFDLETRLDVIVEKSEEAIFKEIFLHFGFDLNKGEEKENGFEFKISWKS